jgi:hypothetical protein
MIFSKKQPKKMLKSLSYEKDMEFLRDILEKKIEDTKVLMAANETASDTFVNDKQLNGLIIKTTEEVLSLMSPVYINEIILVYFKWDGFIAYITKEIQKSLVSEALTINKNKYHQK